MNLERWLHMLPLGWRSLARRTQVEQDLADEIDYHLERQVDDRVTRGVGRDDAWRLVRRDFGGDEQAKEECRDARGVHAIEHVWQDVRYAVRTPGAPASIHRGGLVSGRTRDIGIRLALGARPLDVFWLVIGEGATLCAIGIALGLAGALAATRWLSSELHGVNPADPLTYAAAGAVAIVSLAACSLPTRRAMRVDPLIVLREGTAQL